MSGRLAPSNFRLKDILPKEHGTWAMLLAPWVVGCGVAGRLAWLDGLLLLAIVAGFLAHNQLMVAARLTLPARRDDNALRVTRRRALALALVAAAAAGPVVAVPGGRPLFALTIPAALLTIAGLVLVRRRRDHTLAGQLLAAIGLPLSAPAAHAVATGALDRRGLALWALNALFFVGAVLYVRLKIAALSKRAMLKRPAARLAMAWPTLALDIAVLIAALGALYIGDLAPRALAAFLPVLVQSLIGTWRLDRPARLKRVGLLATGHAAVWAALLIALA